MKSFAWHIKFSLLPLHFLSELKVSRESAKFRLFPTAIIDLPVPSMYPKLVCHTNTNIFAKNTQKLENQGQASELHVVLWQEKTRHNDLVTSKQHSLIRRERLLSSHHVPWHSSTKK